jgi:hypothetical protein
MNNGSASRATHQEADAASFHAVHFDGAILFMYATTMSSSSW